MKRVTVSAADLMLSERREPFVVLNDGYYIFRKYARRATYDVEEDRIRTPLHLVQWIRHLSEKSWFTGSHAIDLIDACAKKNKFKQFVL